MVILVLVFELLWIDDTSAACIPLEDRPPFNLLDFKLRIDNDNDNGDDDDNRDIDKDLL